MRFLYLFFLGILSLSSYSQNRSITGRLTDDSGEPLPGVSVVIKGTTTGTQTDLDGVYSISAPIGSTLVFSYVGFEAQEIVVTEDWPKGIKRARSKSMEEFIRPNFPIELISDSTSNQNGVGLFTYDSKTFKSYSHPEIPRISKIAERKNQFIIRSWDDQSVRKGYGFQYSQMFGILKVTQLPKLQSVYSQGRSNAGALEWSGPESNELFSWGPRVSNLEFDGSDYPYDLNGRLVPVGSGNGIPARGYDNLNFFKIGFINTHDFLFTHSISRRGNLTAGLNWENQTSVLPNAGKERLSAKIDLEEITVGRGGKMSFRSSYANSNGRILSHGANLSRIVADVLSAPVTFDNSNNLTRKDVVDNPLSYETSTGQIRSYAPGSANNPFGIVSTTRDNDELSNYFSAVEYEWSHEPDNKKYWKLNAKGSFDKQKLNSRFGIPFGYNGSSSGLLVERQDEKDQYDLRITPSYRFLGSSYPYWNITFTLDYYLSSISRSIERNDGVDFSLASAFEMGEATTVNVLNRSLDRTSHQLTHSAKVIYKNYTLNIGNSYYFSNTIDQADFTNFLPFIGIRADIYAYPFNLFPKISFSRSVQEPSLIYNDWAYLSTQGQSGQFRSVNETSELFFNTMLRPEIATKLEFDFESRFDFLYQLDFGFTYSYETIDDFIVPISTSGQFNLENVAKVSNESFKVKLGYVGNSWNGPRWSVSTRWTRNVPKVIKSNTQDPIPLSGFSNAFSALSEGQTFGTIYGTFYERDANNNLVIDAAGYPVASNQVKAIANPNPDWLISFDGSIQWRNLTLEALFEYVHGGSIWNGTAAYLDYIGRSKRTGELRETTNFIFDGVDGSGNINTVPVTFLDPDQDISQSRWVRYGAEGVSEEYIEDATSFRLSELILSYSIPIPRSVKLKELSFSLIGRNLFQITPYSGVDPQSSLFGYSLGHGLDMFNMPSTRSYQLKMIVKL